MNISFRNLILLAIAPMAFGQGSQLPKYTVANLPSASSQPTYTVQVIDGLSASDCIAGGGTYNVLCVPHGGIWTSVSATAMSLTTTGTTGAATLVGSTLNIPQYQGALTLTTTGTSGAATLTSNTLNIPQYVGGGSGVQYNPSNTQSIWIGASLLIVNGNPNVTASSVVCTAGSCVMNATQSWSSNIDVGFGGGFSPACLTDQVFPMTGRTGSTVTVNAPACSTTTGTGGNVWDASNSWPEQAQLQPFFSGHGTTLNLGVGAQTVATENSSYTSLYHTQIAACVATGAKCFVYLPSGAANDFAASSSALSGAETNYLQLAAKIHAEGANAIVVGVTTPPSSLNGSGNSFLAQAEIDAFNAWLTAQNIKGAATTGQGWDDIVDVATYARDNGSNNYNSDHIHFSNAGTAHAADLTNSQMASQSSMPSGALPGLAGANYFTGSQVLFDSTNLTSLGWYQFISGGNTYFYQGTSSSAGNGYLMIHPQASNHYLVVPGANVGIGFNSSNIGCGPVCTDQDTGITRGGSSGVLAAGKGGSPGDTSGTYEATDFWATGAAGTANSGQIRYGGTTAAASNCGSLSGAAGCVVLNIAGTTHYVPYY